MDIFEFIRERHELANEACPICADMFGGDSAIWVTAENTLATSCEACGEFACTQELVEDFFNLDGLNTTSVARAHISHLIAINQGRNNDVLLDSDWIAAAINNAVIASPPEQGRRLLIELGKRSSELSGMPIEKLTPDFYSKAGVVGRQQLNLVVRELEKNGFLYAVEIPDSADGPGSFEDLTLSFDGWERYEELRRGKSDGGYGFVAMKFNDPTLESLISDHVKPAILEQLGISVIDLRDVARASIIDNLMREQIRGSAFVLADLTHDNSGAYWEAGYAEGLGKPVIYLCEQSKFDDTNTHFDTNHCMTVPWSVGEEDAFIERLVATIRRSLEHV